MQISLWNLSHSHKNNMSCLTDNASFNKLMGMHNKETYSRMCAYRHTRISKICAYCITRVCVVRIYLSCTKCPCTKCKQCAKCTCTQLFCQGKSISTTWMNNLGQMETEISFFQLAVFQITDGSRVKTRRQPLPDPTLTKRKIG